LVKLFSNVKVVITRGDRRPLSRRRASLFKYRWCDGVILTCRSIYQKNRNIFEPIRHKVHVIYGSVDETRRTPTRNNAATLAKYRLDPGKRIVGIAGRLSPVKGHEVFMRAAAEVVKKFNDTLFLIAGKEVEVRHNELREIARHMNIERHIKLLPRIDDIADVMNCFDIGVIASLGSETISRVLLEYMYLCKPVVGTRVNAIAEIIQPGVNGALVMPEDPATLAHEIKKLLNDPVLMKTFGENSLRLYRQNFSEDRFYEKTIQVFEKALRLDE
jgi:glycosyltransferase involved in cell wall biosynthesis